MDKIILKSRESKNYLKRLIKDGKSSNSYLLVTDSPFLRSGINNTNNKFIDPQGGPMITEGHKIEGTDLVVKSINHCMGKGYVITCE